MPMVLFFGSIACLEEVGGKAPEGCRVDVAVAGHDASMDQAVEAALNALSPLQLYGVIDITVQ